MGLKSILITGANGFIGKHLSKMMAANDDTVVHLFGHPHHELLDQDSLDAVIKTNKPDTVVHLAANSQLRQSIHDPIMDAKKNILASVTLLEWCVKCGVKNVVYTSTGGARYGETDYISCFSEDVRPKPISPYGISKRVVEDYLEYYSRMYGINCIALCLGNVYGPGDDYTKNRIIPTILHKLQNGDTVQIYGNGLNYRDYVYVYDVCRLIQRLATHGFSVPNLIYNISTSPHTINELMTMITAITGLEINREYIKSKPGEIKNVKLDCRQAEYYLGWKPQYSIQDGLRETIEAYGF